MYEGYVLRLYICIYLKGVVIVELLRVRVIGLWGF